MLNDNSIPFVRVKQVFMKSSYEAQLDGLYSWPLIRPFFAEMQIVGSDSSFLRRQTMYTKAVFPVPKKHHYRNSLQSKQASFQLVNICRRNQPGSHRIWPLTSQTQSQTQNRWFRYNMVLEVICEHKNRKRQSSQQLQVHRWQPMTPALVLGICQCSFQISITSRPRLTNTKIANIRVQVHLIPQAKNTLNILKRQIPQIQSKWSSFPIQCCDIRLQGNFQSSLQAYIGLAFSHPVQVQIGLPFVQQVWLLDGALDLLQQVL
eukprot:TRINITY_DN28394_c0_g1_i1.p1 TRINITY_DN28394_c0_g1~~TRINITY_DN28394_c0_g1_i1.p1  ORF type:complete len:262 (-),score=-51.18 TRINITY_DN28394_c0_g1_i1:245-1030(-)